MKAEIVPPEGPRKARIMLVGQSPGREEVGQGKPFVGRSGRYLNRVLAKNGLQRKDLFITNVVKQGTPGNRKPTAAEIKRWMPCLIEEIERVKPKVIVLMGKVAQETPHLKGVRYIETYHPTAAMRFPKARKKFEEDFKKLKEESDQTDFPGDEGRN